MARAFTAASSMYGHYTGGAVLTAMPLSMHCWFRPSDLTAIRFLMCLGNNGTNGYFGLYISGAVAGDPISANHQSDSGTTGTSTTATGCTVNTWHQAGAVFASTTSRKAYIDGVGPAANTTSIAAPTPNFTSVGVLKLNALLYYMSGRICDAAIWNVALADYEMAALAKGVLPLFIRPESLVSYWPMHGDDSPEQDWHPRSVVATDYPLTLVNSPAKAEHAPVIPYSSRLWRGSMAAEDLAGAAFIDNTTPIIRHVYGMSLR
jgi:hypothetical protein